MFISGSYSRSTSISSPAFVSSHQKVSRVICISPIAPAPDTASARKELSVSMTAQIISGGTPYSPEYSSISSA